MWYNESKVYKVLCICVFERATELKTKMIGRFLILFHLDLKHMRIQASYREERKKGTKRPLRNYHTNVKNKSNIAFVTL